MSDVPNIYDIILSLISANDGQFAGKTNVHKNLYLIKEMLSKDQVQVPYRFKPYFYGPFSIDVSYALDLLQSSGLLDSDERELGRDDIEMRQTVYRLTDFGKKAVEKAKASYPEFSNGFGECFRRIRGTNHHQNTQVLATAAKVKLIVSQEGKSLTIPKIKSKAQELGWKINDSDINAAIKVLTQTDLVSVRGKKGDPA